MATEIRNASSSIVTLPPALGSHVLGASSAVIVAHSVNEVIAILGGSRMMPPGILVRAAPGEQPTQPVSDSFSLPEATMGNMVLPVDYATGWDGPSAAEGVTFTEQADVDAYLTVKEATAFKYPTKVWDNAIPRYIRHLVQFRLAPGVHRPENPLPADAQAAWDFSRLSAPPKEFVEGGQLIITPDPDNTDYFTKWTEVIPGAIAVTSMSAGDGVTPPNIVVSGTPFGADNSLVGYYVLSDNFFSPRVILGNTSNTVYLSSNQNPPTPATIKIMKPSIVLRNSYDDISTVKSTTFYLNGTPSSRAASVYISSLCLDQMGSPAGFYLLDVTASLYAVMFDHAGQKNTFGKDNFGTCVRAEGRRLDTTLQFWASSIRGPRYATSPGANAQAPITFTGKEKTEASKFTGLYSVIGGVTQVIPLTRGLVSLRSFCLCDVFGVTTCMTITDMIVSPPIATQLPIAGFWRCPGGIVFTRCDLYGTGYAQLLFDGQVGAYSMFAFVDGCRSLAAPILLRQGLVANAGIAVHVSNNCDLQFDSASDLVGSTATARLSASAWAFSGVDRDFTWPQLDALRSVKIQPGGTLLGVVKVLDVDDGTNIGGNANLQYTNATNLLAYQAYGDSGYGAGVDVSAGGEFELRSANGYGIRVRVQNQGLPGADATVTFQAARGFYEEPYLNTRIARSA